nr:MAG: hypothetical protein [Bacteriophage sp.]
MVFDITVSRYDVGKCPHCGKPIKGTICRGDSRMTQLQEAIHNKITTYSEDE